MCAMAYKHREDIVGKRFLCISSTGKLKFSKISEWDWRAGIIRAASHKDPKHPDLTILVEFDYVEWERREWIRLYEDKSRFQVFLVEQTLTWSLRKDCPLGVKNADWPALNFKCFVDRVGLGDHKLKPIEHLVDRRLGFVDYSDLKVYQEQDIDGQAVSRDYDEVRKAVKQWVEFQDGQRILLTTPSVLVGYRVEVYRAEGATQWYTAVIVSYNDNTKELTLTDDTVLEEHNEDPCLVQMKLIGDGVVESILKGENVGITPRRRTCTLNNTSQHQKAGHYTRTRNQTGQAQQSQSSPSGNSSVSSGGKLVSNSASRKSRTKPAECVPQEPVQQAEQKQEEAADKGVSGTERRRKASGSSDGSSSRNRSQSSSKKSREVVPKVPPGPVVVSTARKSQRGSAKSPPHPSVKLSVGQKRKVEGDISDSESKHCVKSSEAEQVTAVKEEQQAANVCQEPQQDVPVRDSDSHSSPAPKEETSPVKEEQPLQEEASPAVVVAKSETPRTSVLTHAPITTVSSGLSQCSVVTTSVHHSSVPAAVLDSNRDTCKPSGDRPPKKAEPVAEKANVKTAPDELGSTNPGAQVATSKSDTSPTTSGSALAMSSHPTGPVCVSRPAEATTTITNRSIVHASSARTTSASDSTSRGSSGDSVKVYRDPILSTSATVRHLDSAQHTRLMQQPPQGLYPPRGVPGLSSQQQAVVAAASRASHPPAHIAAAAAYGLPSAGHPMMSGPAQLDHLAYQRLIASTQFGGLDVLWGQKVAAASLPPAQAPAQAWTLGIQEEYNRLSQERQTRLDRERREEHEKMEREKSERDKAEKERQERERERHERERERHERERERHEKEEQERAQREAVQQHFEESLRLASQKTFNRILSGAQNPHQNHLDSSKAALRAGWSPIASLPYGKSGSSGPTQSEKSRDKHEQDHHDKYSEAARARQQQLERERWLTMVQQQQQQQQRLEMQSQVASHHRLPHPEVHGSSIKHKMEAHPRSSPKSSQLLNAPSPAMAPKIGSPATSSPSSSMSAKTEPSFNLYGYQPFPQMYITQAQLKAREESKTSHHSQLGSSSSSSRQTHVAVTSPTHMPRVEKDLRFERSSPGGTRGSPKPPLQGRGSPSVVSTGAFRPYEYNSPGPAPAHQGSISRTTPNFPPQQEEPQNLVKSSRPRQDSPQSSSAATPSTSIPVTFSQSVSKQPYSYSLIQQGLVPNPLYTPASSGSAVQTTQASAKVLPTSSSPSSVQYLRTVSGAGITTGTPVCRPLPVTHTDQKPSFSCSPLNQPPSHHRISAPVESQPRHSVPQPNSPSSQGTNSSTPPQLTPPPPQSSSTQQSQPLNLQQSASPNPPKRKVSKDSSGRKRQKSEEPQSPPTLQYSGPSTVSNPNPASSPIPLVSTPSSQPESPAPSVSPAATTAPSTTGTNAPARTSGFMDSFKYFVTNQPQSVQDIYSYKHGKARNKTRPAAVASPPSGEDSKPSSVAGSSVINESDSDTRVTPSPAPSSCTTISNSSSNHTKLKKAWLQRHSEIEDKKVPENETKVQSENNDSVSVTSSVSPVKSEPGIIKNPPNGLDTERTSPLRDEGSSSSSASENEKQVSNRKTRVSRKRGMSSKEKSSKRQKANSESQSDATTEDTPIKKEDNESRSASEKETVRTRRRGRRPKTKNRSSEDLVSSSKKKSVKPVEKPSLAQLKKTGQPFLQDGTCYDVAPKLPKCRECRMSPHQRNKKMPNIFCRFYAFRKLRYGKNGTLLSAGFSEPNDASEEDLKLWLPPTADHPKDLNIETANILICHVGDQFCDLVEQEREAQSLHMGTDKTISWKRVVQGVREMCDVCETTLFNIHWVCHKCGFVVCIDCYKARKNGTVKEEESPPKDRDEYQWLFCSNRQKHEQDKLMMTQIIAGSALWDVGVRLHEIRKKWNIPSYCSCFPPEQDVEPKKTPNGICKQLMSAVSKCFNDKEAGVLLNGETPRSGRKSKNSINGVANISRQDDVAGYSSESGGSPLSVLADVALNSTSKMEEDEEEKEGDLKDEDGEHQTDFSTLRELLIRPAGRVGGNNGNSKKTSSLDEVISCVIEQRVGKNGDNKEEKQLVHFARRFPQAPKGREPLPVRVFTLAESSLLFPKVQHSWLCNGKLLVLHDPKSKHNLTLFQEQWKRGQPVVVADVNKNLNISLWHPDGFCKDFGEIRNDLVNCKTGAILPNLPMRKFWEGFENFSKRMKDDDGEYMLLKLKDWPPGEDFSELLPSRFNDLMKVLPLPEYTHRDGVLNLAGRLPECFVRPDLGPKMYNAYGSALYPTKGTTNLHLDVSDAVNVMVYVGIPKDGKDEEHIEEALKAIDQGACDSLMRKRVREKGAKPGALWHIFNARDADKIRDLLNKVAVERGETLEAHHDPIHDQSWYLDSELRERLYKEYKVEGYAIAQCLGDSVFIPAGAPHQVRNLHSCVKVAEDFVSPENIAHCFSLTHEFRQLSDTHTNHEDKLQIKNVIYHAVKDALALLEDKEPGSSSKKK